MKQNDDLAILRLIILFLITIFLCICVVAIITGQAPGDVFSEVSF